MEQEEPLAAAPLPPDSAALAAWIDGWMAARLDADHVAGATVSIVHDGRLVFAKGYGWADVDAREPVEADRTLFRIGSISKLFVWTSVMQLVEQGRLDLHQDVNTYLKDIQVPATYDRPVTLADLMTHSAGFEDHVVGLFATDTSALEPMEQVLQEQLPARVRPPGDVTSYSNHGTALAMQVVQDVSGENWIDYIQRHILDPLGMTHTTFRQPLPAALAPDMSEGYGRGGAPAEAFELVPLGAVGACSSTATDMARFMLAHLQLGRLGDSRILEEATAREMQSALFSNAPNVDPFLHGFADLSRHGLHIIGHGGDTFWFHSQLSLLPDRGLGVFVSVNTDGASPGAFVDAFLKRYFDTGEPPAIRAPDDFASRVDRFTGRFRVNRFSHTDFTKIMALSTVKVSSSGDTALAMRLGDDRIWIEVSPLTFRAAHSDRTIAFRQNEDGDITHMFLGDAPYASFERVPWSENPILHEVLGILAGAVFLLTLIAIPVMTWFRWRHGVSPEDPVPGIARLVGWLGALVYLGFAVAMAVTLSDPNQIAMGHVEGLRLVRWLPALGVALTGLTLVFVVITWVSGRGSRVARWAYTVLGVVMVTFIWQLHVWNLLVLKV
ncbi:MAG: serine hydrolase domain-containing protein [Gemmatimonadota bacterium]|jgi:CubicO group peptidase (beta-lactamase class C family)